MANPCQLAILMEGIGDWRHWRFEHPGIRPDLTDANLQVMDLTEMNLAGAILTGADLRLATLAEADLTDAILTRADLTSADLSGACLRNADFCDSHVGYTTLRYLDLSVAKGLKTVIHDGPSWLDFDTLYRSNGRIPEVFLRGCGVPESMIKYIPSLTRQSILYYSCFISYSTADKDLAQRLHADLQNKGVRCWFAPEDMRTGDKMRPAIYDAIRLHDKLLLLLSRSSVQSDWVGSEVETAMEREQREGKTVLFPVRIDDAVMETDSAWASDLRRRRHIGDFRSWTNYSAYQEAFARLLRDLSVVSR